MKKSALGQMFLGYIVIIVAAIVLVAATWTVVGSMGESGKSELGARVHLPEPPTPSEPVIGTPSSCVDDGICNPDEPGDCQDCRLCPRCDASDIPRDIPYFLLNAGYEMSTAGELEKDADAACDEADSRIDTLEKLCDDPGCESYSKEALSNSLSYYGVGESILDSETEDEDELTQAYRYCLWAKTLAYDGINYHCTRYPQDCE
ncbi:MAG: hypothetical protein JXB14_01585 [Candidatus Altiarchaeota archaeon]|nr:hypothetical protein [Candidatus Altiarchaeota archaeon]